MADDQALAPQGSMDVTVVTPLRHVLTDHVDEITAYGSLGEFGVLPGHIPLLTMLDTGVLVLHGRGGRQVYAHGPGYLEVGAHGEVEILVERAELAADVDVELAKTELADAETELNNQGSVDHADWKNLTARRDWAMAQIAASVR